jgi:hypothetical protein
MLSHKLYTFSLAQSDAFIVSVGEFVCSLLTNVLTLFISHRVIISHRVTTVPT